MAGKKKYSEEQIEALYKFYPNSEYDKLELFFPGKSKKQFKSLANYYGVKNNNPGHVKNLVGQRFNRLLVVSFCETREQASYWNCTCDCGKEIVVKGELLTRGNVQSCGCLRRENREKGIDHTGDVFGMLTAKKRLPHYKGGRTYYECVCECGNHIIVSGSSLASGRKKCCGCLSKDRSEYWIKTHNGEADHRKYSVYMHTAPNSKRYIGITKQEVEKRWQNGVGYKSQKLFWRAINKYRWENIKHEIIEENLSLTDAFKREEYYIALYKTTNTKYGYNVLAGGTKSRLYVTPVMQYKDGIAVNFFETCAEAARCLGVSPLTIKHYINRNDLPDGYSFRFLTKRRVFDVDESLYEIENKEHYIIVELMRKKTSQNTISRNKEKTRRINQYDLNGHFLAGYSSIKEACVKMGCIDNSQIGAAVRGTNGIKTACGFQWRYSDGNTTDIEPVDNSGVRKKIYQYSPTNPRRPVGEFPSIAEASRVSGVSNSKISLVANGKRKTAGGFVWKFE